MLIQVESIVNDHWSEAAAGIREKVFGENSGQVSHKSPLTQ
jgi:hypothetical protein